MDNQQPPHILIVAFPIQGHISPALEFASRLLRAGALVTFVTTTSGAKRINSYGSKPAGLSFATISDGYDDSYERKLSDTSTTKPSLRRRGSETLSALISAGPADGSPPYTAVTYTIFLSWVAEVARLQNLPSAVLWLQNAALFTVYYHYFNGYSHVIDKCDKNDPEWSIKLPSLPLLGAKDLPSLGDSSKSNAFAWASLSQQFAQLALDENPVVLVNSFDALDHEILDSFKTRFRISAVGPLLPPSFQGKEATEFSTLKVDMHKRSEVDYLAWLDKWPNNSVVYVAFGSVSDLHKAQMEELEAALAEMGRPFLWVVTPEAEKDEELPRKEQMMEKGLVVTWCSQVDVLSHKAVGCFVTHCGWNSTIESLAAGMPVVGLPQWIDQTTNAKMAEMWGMGVRAFAGKKKVVGREEIRRCVDQVIGNEEMRESARKWQELAAAATMEGGSSEVNLSAFVEEMRGTSKA